jgi:conjugative relaxase-like TrwC/TraI family protein
MDIDGYLGRRRLLMMSMSLGMKAGQAGGYFSLEDYYLKGAGQGQNSRWCGKGAESLDLSGPVREEEFRALCAGRHPGTGEQLVSPKLTRDKTGGLVETHRAGNDCTLSDPKTVSIAYMLGVPGIKEAHDAAVLAVAGQLEEHYSFCRCPGGVVHGVMVAAVFDHATSRNLDPQLHSHLFLVNMARDPEGGWKANWPRTIFDDQKSLGLLYRQELAHELQERGFAIAIVDRSQMFFELQGVDPRLVEHFSSRRKAIEKQVALWRAEGKFINLPHARLFEMAALETRDPKREVAREDVVRAFERGLESCGTSAREVRRELERARHLALERPRESTEYSAPEVVRLAAERLVDREAVLDRARLLDQSVLVSGGGHSVRELNLALDGTEGVLRLGEERGREYYTTAGMRRLEAGNLETVKGLEPFRSLTTSEEIAAYREVWQEREGVRLTDGQMEQVFHELLGTHAVLATEGKPGTGKTLASRFIEDFNIEVLQPKGKDHFTVNIAYTGKAALEMERASGRPGFTVDSFLNASARGEVPLQGLEATLAGLEGGGEKNLIPGARQVVLRLDEAGVAEVSFAPLY